MDIFAARDGGIEIVEENLDECVLCELCLDAAPPGRRAGPQALRRRRRAGALVGMLLRLLPAIAAVAAIGVLLAVGAPGGAAPRDGRLPDLRQELPTRIGVTGESLGFASAVSNVGAGPLIVSGRRPGRAQPQMVAEQLVRRHRAPSAVIAGVGRLRYVTSADHEHWHLLPFMRYELRDAGPGGVVRRDRKTGFCLGDRYPVRGERLPAGPPQGVYTSRCGLRATARLHLVQGISVGFGDDYDPYLEGQSLSLRGLPAGRYVLVHRVNGGRRLRESDFANNAASVLLRLTRRSGEPRVRVLRRCPATSGAERPSFCRRLEASAPVATGSLSRSARSARDR